MITSHAITQIEEDDKILGTPSTQKILRLFTIWETMTLREIIEKSELSEAQIHKTLINLQKISLVTKKDKGVYYLSNNSFSKTIQNAYINRLLPYISSIISEIHEELDKGNRDKAHDRFHYLGIKYEPILRKNFSYKMNSLVHRFLDE